MLNDFCFLPFFPTPLLVGDHLGAGQHGLFFIHLSNIVTLSTLWLLIIIFTITLPIFGCFSLYFRGAKVLRFGVILSPYPDNLYSHILFHIPELLTVKY